MTKTLTFCAAVILAMAGPAAVQAKTAHPAAATTSAPANLASDQFSSEPAAKAHCPGDTIVWANLGGSKAYHLSGDRYYGKTKHGAYMCQKDADRAGLHAAGHRATKATAKTTPAKPAH